MSRPARRRVLITGASAGLGAEMARQYVARGHDVALCARRGGRLADLRAELLARHPERTVLTRVLDVDDHADVFSAFHQLAGELGGLDRVIVNAGLGKGARIGTGRFDVNKQTITTNLVSGLAQCEVVWPARPTGPRGAGVALAAVKPRAEVRAAALGRQVRLIRAASAVSTLTWDLWHVLENVRADRETLATQGIVTRMDLLRTDALRGYAQHRERARSTPARVVLPVVLAGGAQVLLVAGGLLLDLPVIAVVALALGLAVVSAIIHRRTVGSLVAGAGIRVAQPYLPGEQVRLYVPALGAVEDAEVVRVGPANTTLMTSGGLVLVPNEQMLRGTDPR